MSYKLIRQDTLPRHKIRTQVDSCHAEINVQDDGPTGIHISVENTWINAGKTRVNVHEGGIHLELEQVIDLLEALHKMGFNTYMREAKIPLDLVIPRPYIDRQDKHKQRNEDHANRNKTGYYSWML